MGVKTNRAAIGARIHLTVTNRGRAGAVCIYRTVSSGGSFGASPLATAHRPGEIRAYREAGNLVADEQHTAVVCECGQGSIPRNQGVRPGLPEVGTAAVPPGRREAALVFSNDRLGPKFPDAILRVVHPHALVPPAAVWPLQGYCCASAGACIAWQSPPARTVGLRIIVVNSADAAQQILDKVKGGADFSKLAKGKFHRPDGRRWRQHGPSGPFVASRRAATSFERTGARANNRCPETAIGIRHSAGRRMRAPPR